MFSILSRVRYIAYVAVFSSAIGSVFMFLVGARRVYDAITHYIFGIPEGRVPEHLSIDEIAAAELIMSVDTFLLAMALLYFAYAIYFLAIQSNTEAVQNLPKWLAPRSFGDLKETLAIVIIIILMVLTLKTMLLELESLHWELLILPATILMTAVALRALAMRER